MRLKPYVGSRKFVFQDPDTGRNYAAKDKPSLIRLIIAYREQNELEPIEQLEAVLENYWCTLPENMGACEPNMHLSRGFLQYLRGGIALVMNMAYGERNIASKEEADRRAEICIDCEYNNFPDKGAFDVWADEVAIASVGPRKCTKHKELGNCSACSCPLRAKVFWGGKIDLTEEEAQKMRKVNCWQTTILDEKK